MGIDDRKYSFTQDENRVVQLTEDELEPYHLHILLVDLINQYEYLPEQVQLRFRDYLKR